MRTWQAKIFDNWDDASPSRWMIIVANTEDEALSAATAQMGSAARIEFVPRSSQKGTARPDCYPTRFLGRGFSELVLTDLTKS